MSITLLLFACAMPIPSGPDAIPTRDGAASGDEPTEEVGDTGADPSGEEGDTGTEPEEPAPDFADYDDFDEDKIIWLHTDVSGWDVTSTVTGGHITHDELCVYHTKAGEWPKVYGIFPEDPEAPMEGNIWVIARVEGLWYAATFDYLRPGDECKYEDFSPSGEGPGPSTFGAVPLSTWLPQSGEPVYMFMSTLARHEVLGPLQERSDYVRLIWP
jgi:hypothetical protein